MPMSRAATVIERCHAERRGVTRGRFKVMLDCEVSMGEHADYLTDEQEDLYFDHLAGHPMFPCDSCPYCDSEFEAEKKKNKKSNAAVKPRRHGD